VGDLSVHSEQGIWAVVPVKPFELAKQRLAEILDRAEREQLMRCMVQDVVAALRKSRGIDGILLVSRSAAVKALAQQLDVEHWQESESADLSQAVSEAGDWVIQRHSAQATLIIPGDVPLLEPGEIERLVACCGTREPCLALVPDRREEGTNAVLSSPPNLIPYRYDGTSFKPHLRAAQQRGVDPITLHLASIELDIDTPEDLQQFLWRISHDRGGNAAHKHPARARGMGSHQAGGVTAGHATTAFLASINLRNRLADYLYDHRGCSPEIPQSNSDVTRRTG